MAEEFCTNQFFEEHLKGKKHGHVQGEMDARLINKLLKNFAHQHNLGDIGIEVHISKPSNIANPLDNRWDILWIRN